MAVLVRLYLAVLGLVPSILVITCVEGSGNVQSSVKSHMGRDFTFGLLDVGTSVISAHLDIAAVAGGHFYIKYRGNNYDYYINPQTSISSAIASDFISDNPMSDVLDYRGISITSNTDISVLLTVVTTYGVTSEVIYPVSSAQSTSFQVVSYDPVDFMTSEFLVVAIDDNTTVTGRYKRTSTAVVLDRLDAYLYTASNDLTGSQITASKPVVVFAGTTKSFLGKHASFDPATPDSSYTSLAAQMLPGCSRREFIIPVVKPYENQIVRVITDGSYNLTVNDGVSTKQHPLKGIQSISVLNRPSSFSSSVPVTLALYNNPFMAIVPGVDQYLNEYAFVVPGYQLYRYNTQVCKLAVIILRKSESGLVLDGLPYGTTLNRDSVRLNTDWYSVLTRNVTTGYHHIVHTDPTVKFGLLVYGKYGNHTEYGFGFFAGMDLSDNGAPSHSSVPSNAISPSNNGIHSKSSSSGHTSRHASSSTKSSSSNTFLIVVFSLLTHSYLK